MKHILVYSDRQGIYGAERINQEIALELKRAGYRVTVAQPAGRNELTDQLDDADVMRYDLPWENVYDASTVAESLVNPKTARECFESTSPDLVFFGDGFPFSNLAAKLEAIECKIAYLTLVHVVHPRWSIEFAAYAPELIRAMQSARAVVAVSQNNLELLHQHFGLNSGLGVVIHNGRPEEFFAPSDPGVRRRVRQELGIGEDEVVLATVGRFDHEKGHDLLLDAVPQLRKNPCWETIRMVWVGDGHLLGRARQLAKLLGGGRIMCLGARSDVAALLDASDILVHPSRSEGLPLVVLEGMAKGLAIIATDVGGISEALGETGLLLPPPGFGDFKDLLADSIVKLVTDKESRLRLGIKAHDRAANRFTESHMMSQWCSLIRQLTGDGE